MLKEISYWTYYFFLKRKYLKDGGHKSDSVMFISVCLFFNFASIIQIIEYYAHFTLPRFPITTKWELSSWIYAIIILTPFIFLYIIDILNRKSYRLFLKSILENQKLDC